MRMLPNALPAITVAGREAMSDADNYRANLAACWQRAEKTPDELEKRAWLEMGESWRLLIISGYGSSAIEGTAVVPPKADSEKGMRLRDAHQDPAKLAAGARRLDSLARFSCCSTDRVGPAHGNAAIAERHCVARKAQDA